MLRPGGSLLFIEHGRAPEPDVQRWQDRLTPLWRRLAGGCHLNRPIDRLIEAAGLRLAELETGYLIEGPRLVDLPLPRPGDPVAGAHHRAPESMLASTVLRDRHGSTMELP